MCCRIQVRAAGLAVTRGLDKKVHVDTDMADTPDIHVHNTGLREAPLQEVVSIDLSHVHRLDRLPELRCSMDDNDYW